MVQCCARLYVPQHLSPHLLWQTLMSLQSAATVSLKGHSLCHWHRNGHRVVGCVCADCACVCVCSSAASAGQNVLKLGMHPWCQQASGCRNGASGSVGIFCLARCGCARWQCSGSHDGAWCKLFPGDHIGVSTRALTKDAVWSVYLGVVCLEV